MKNKFKNPKKENFEILTSKQLLKIKGGGGTDGLGDGGDHDKTTQQGGGR